MIELHTFAGLVDRLVVDTSETQPAYLLVGKSGRHMRLSSSAYFLLRRVYEGASCEDIAQEIAQSGGAPCTSDDLAAAYARIIARLTEIETAPETKRSGFWLRVRCLPQSLVRHVARPLTGMFHPFVAGGIIVLISIAIWLTFQLHRPTSIQPQTFWIAYLLFFCSILVHEFGHASACLRFGAVPGDIGFALYWIYPILYSDVSTAWTLKRWQRVIVDIGGVFFQLAFLVGCVALFYTTQWEPAYFATQMILSSVLFSINPILKFDGYWVLADAFGITNLGQQPRNIARAMWARLRGLPAPTLPWSRSTIVFVTLYTVISVGFWGYFLGRLLPFFWLTLLRYPTLISELIAQVSQPGAAFPTQLLVSLLTSTFISFISLLMIQRVGGMVMAFLLQFMARRRAHSASDAFKDSLPASHEV